MADVPWRGDAVSLVEAFRSGERSPVEELQATLAAIDASNLNAFCFLDREAAERDAKNALLIHYQWCLLHQVPLGTISEVFRY